MSSALTLMPVVTRARTSDVALLPGAVGVGGTRVPTAPQAAIPSRSGAWYVRELAHDPRFGAQGPLSRGPLVG